jgi:hypothetical protein
MHCRLVQVFEGQKADIQAFPALRKIRVYSIKQAKRVRNIKEKVTTMLRGIFSNSELEVTFEPGW